MHKEVDKEIKQRIAFNSESVNSKVKGYPIVLMVRISLFR